MVQQTLKVTLAKVFSDALVAMGTLATVHLLASVNIIAYTFLCVVKSCSCKLPTCGTALTDNYGQSTATSKWWRDRVVGVAGELDSGLDRAALGIGMGDEGADCL